MTVQTESRALEELAAKYYVLHGRKADTFERKSRILQSMWRDEQGYEMGKTGNLPDGTLLKMPWAEQTLSNYLDAEIRGVVEKEVNGTNKHLRWPAIFNSLTDCQALCLNLFAPLQEDLALATAVFSKLLPEHVGQVTSISFAYSNAGLKNNFNANVAVFDVFVTYESLKGYDGFVAIDTRYDQDITGDIPDPCLLPEKMADIEFLQNGMNSELREGPLSQLLHKHFATDSMVFYDSFDEGLFMLFFPRDNVRCAEIVERYRRQLKSSHSFLTCTLEHFHHILTRCSIDDWVALFYDRYLDFDKVSHAV